MLTFDPAWSVVFDLAVGVAIVWLALELRKLRPFRRLNIFFAAAVGVAIAAPVVYFGNIISLAASFLAVPALAALAYADTEQPLSFRGRIFLTATRIAVFIVIIICLLRPRLEYEHEQFHKACAYVVADVSGSMDSQDSPPESSRVQTARAILHENDRVLAEISRKFDYRFGIFDEKFERAADAPDSTRGSSTNIADTLSGVARDLAGAKAAGVILLTDGRHNTPGDCVAAAARLGVPVHAICIGGQAGASTAADSAIERLDYSERVFVRNLATFNVRIAYNGPPVRAFADVTLTADGERVAFERVALPEPGKSTAVELRYTPQEIGINNMKLTLSPAENDVNLKNNEREFLMRVTKSALKVLFIEGEVRWEYKFLKRALSGSENIQLICLNAFLANDVGSLLPRTKEEWDSLHLVIIGDLPANRLTPAALERLREFVADGGSILMLGGFNTLGPGGYGNTALAKALPVDVDRNDAQSLDALRLEPTRDGVEHDVLRAGTTDETRKMWDILPPVSGYTRVASVKPLARVLVQAPRGEPVLVVQDYERGRAAVFAADTTWRWIFNEGKFADYHRTFWRQLVNWLTKSRYEGGGGIWVETDRLRYLAGDRPTLKVNATGALGDAGISVNITGPELNLRIPLGNGAGRYEMRLPQPITRAGEYEVAAFANAEPETFDSTARFVVQDYDIERDAGPPDRELLKSIASATGGKFYERKDAAQAFAELLQQESGTTVRKASHRRLCDNAYVYAALCGLLCVEWITRKRRGLA